MKKAAFIFLIAFAIIIGSCKKKTANNDAAAPGGTGGGTPQQVQGYYGQLNGLQTVILGFGSPQPQTVITALFFNSAVTNSAVLSVNAGTVSVNGVTLKYDITNPGGPAYADSTYNITGPPFNLFATGIGTMSPISFSYTAAYPTLVDTSSIPSAITRSLGISITFTNVSTADSLGFIISSGSGQVSKNFAVSNNSSQINFTPTELNALTATNNGGGFIINLLKNKLLQSNSKNYLVQLEKRYYKIGVAIN